MTTLKASIARIPPDTFNRVAYRRERIRIERRGARAVYLVSEEDLRIIEEAEDRRWLEEGRRALAESKRSGGRTIPWPKTRRKLGH